MSIAAQLAQKTKFFIAGAGGAAKTITGITPGFPTKAEAAAHGLQNGDSVTLAAIVGTIGTDATSGLNGKTVVVKYASANTFSFDINTTGLVYTSGGTATAAAWIQIKELKAIKPSGANTSKLDATDLDSDAMEYLPGLVDNGTVSLEVNILESDPGQAAALAMFTDSRVKSMKVQSPQKTRTFYGIFTKWPTIQDSAVNGIQTGSAELQVSGAVTVS